MQGLLTGRSALVTGGGSGIGRTSAHAFAREGARVTVADLSQERAITVAEEISRVGGDAIAIGVDVTDEAAVEAMVEAAVARWGGIDCAFNCAGVAPYQVNAAGLPMAQWEAASFDRLMTVNVKGLWMCMKYEIIQMERQHAGSIVNAGSIAGLSGSRNSSPYAASKHAVIGLTKCAALEYANAAIRVNAVCPGYITTPMTEDMVKRRGEEMMTRVPLGRMGRPEEIAEMVVWLCSDLASFVTGAAFNVDGGYMAG